MTQAMRWAWVALFAACALIATWINIHQQRILVLHEANAEDPTAKAFKLGLEAHFKSATNLKVRYQYLGWDPDVCKNILFTLSSFSPHIVIAEGEPVSACLTQAPSTSSIKVFAMGSTLRAEDRERFSGAWQRVLQDLITASSPILILHGPKHAASQQTQALSNAGAVAGFSMHTRSLDAVDAPDQLKQAIERLAPAAIIYLPTFASTDQNALAPKDLENLQQLRQLTHAPIFSTRLNSLHAGADMALEQAPEQRGEWLAHAALHPNQEAAPLSSPYEMAIGIRRDFSDQKMAQALPTFYTLSASMAGFIYDPP